MPIEYKDEDTCPDCDGRNTLHLEDKTHECHDCGETYEVKGTGDE